MTPDRGAWVVGVMLATMLCIRLAGPVPTRTDEKLAERVALIANEVRQNYVDDVSPELLEENAIGGMLEKLDPYTQYFPPREADYLLEVLEGNFVGIGVTIRENSSKEIEVVSPIEGSPALAAGIRAGDVLLRANGKSLSGLTTENASQLVKGPAGTKVTITLRRIDGSVDDVRVERRMVHVPSIAGYERLDDGKWNFLVDPELKIGYIRLVQFTTGSNLEVLAAMNSLREMGMTALVLDLRFNPGGTVEDAVAIADQFLESGTIVSIRGRQYPTRIVEAQPGQSFENLPLAVLINQDSASASEILAGALKDHDRAVVVGTRSFGKGSVQTTHDFSNDGGTLKMTVAHYYLPSGRVVHRKIGATDWGVDPQINVPMNDQQMLVLLRAWSARDVIRNGPATQPTEADDPQLKEAIKALTAMMISAK